MSDAPVSLVPSSRPGQQPLSLYDRVRMALLEDHGPGGEGDVTSRALIPPGLAARGIIQAKAPGVLCGVNLLALIFQLAEELIDPRAQDRVEAQREAEEAAKAGRLPWQEAEERVVRSQADGIQIKVLKKDGARLTPGEAVAELSGHAPALLFGERTALNLLCHLSGIATLTARCVERCAGTRAKVVDTRKTTPLWRDLEKYAVKCGGGENHRRGLYDMALIKDNHLALWGSRDPAEAVRVVRARYPQLPVEIEVQDLAGLAKVCRGGAPGYVLLDNFDFERLRQAVTWCDEFYKNRPGRPLLEASGGVTFEGLGALAQTGVDRISMGALTHSAPALDLSLELNAGLELNGGVQGLDKAKK